MHGDLLDCDSWHATTIMVEETRGDQMRILALATNLTGIKDSIHYVFERIAMLHRTNLGRK